MESLRIRDQVLAAGIGAAATHTGIEPDHGERCAGRQAEISQARLSRGALRRLHQTMRDMRQKPRRRRKFHDRHIASLNASGIET
jgi:hypothetical protein